MGARASVTPRAAAASKDPRHSASASASVPESRPPPAVPGPSSPEPVAGGGGTWFVGACHLPHLDRPPVRYLPCPPYPSPHPHWWPSLLHAICQVVRPLCSSKGRTERGPQLGPRLSSTRQPQPLPMCLQRTSRHRNRPQQWWLSWDHQALRPPHRVMLYLLLEQQGPRTAVPPGAW
jgi:hypothetical protein